MLNKNKVFLLKSFIVWLLVFIFFKIPVVLVRDLVVDYFNKKSSPNILGNIFFYMFEILYILLFVLLIKNWIKKNF